jgi:hypothetical protein
MEKIDFQKLQRPDWLADGPARFEMLTSDYGPDDQNPAQSKALETKFSELASKYDATRFEHFEEKLDPLRGRIKKATRTDAFIIDVEWLKDITIRTVEYVIASGTAVAFLKLARDPLLQWLKNHGAREIVIRKGGWSIRVKGNNDIEQAIAAMQRISEGSNDTKKRKANQTTTKKKRKN